MKLSEALEKLDKIGNYLNEVYDYKEIKEEVRKDIDTIKQALIKSQEQEKMLRIIKEYQVDIWLLLNCNYDDYIRIRKECLIENKILVDNEEKNDILPEEFFYYLNEALENDR